MSRSHIYIRPLRPNDADIAAFRAAMEAHPDRFYPRDVFSLPTTRVMVAERHEPHGFETIGYQGWYQPLVLGSWIPNDGASQTEIASALHQLTAAAYTRCNELGLESILIHSNTPETIAFAKRHNYKKTHDTLRLEVR